MSFFKKTNYIFKKFSENVEDVMSVKCEVVQWTGGVFRHDSGVHHIVYGVWGGYRRALPFSPFVVPFGMYLDNDKDISILVELASCYC